MWNKPGGKDFVHTHHISQDPSGMQLQLNLSPKDTNILVKHLGRQSDGWLHGSVYPQGHLLFSLHGCHASVHQRGRVQVTHSYTMALKAESGGGT